MQVDTSRFQISQYLPQANESKEATAFEALQAVYRRTIQQYLDQPDFQQLLSNKSLALLFLDKVYSQLDPLAEQIAKYGNCASTFAVMEMIRYLNKVKEHPSLEPMTKIVLEAWIAQAERSLRFHIIFDGMRALEPRLLELMQFPTKEKIQKFIKLDHTLKPDHKDITTIATQIAEDIKQLRVGQSLAIPMGTVLHETRIVVTRVEKGFELVYLNTGEGINTDKKHDNAWFIDLSSDRLDASFWSSLISFKLVDKQMSQHWDQWRIHMTCEGVKPIEFAHMHQKRADDLMSCSFHSLLADLKYVMTSQAPGGLLEYKLVRSLMCEEALKEIEQDRGELNPILKKALKERASIKTHMIKLSQQLKDEKAFNQLKTEFLTLFDTLDQRPIDYRLKKLQDMPTATLSSRFEFIMEAQDLLLIALKTRANLELYQSLIEREDFSQLKASQTHLFAKVNFVKKHALEQMEAEWRRGKSWFAKIKAGVYSLVPTKLKGIFFTQPFLRAKSLQEKLLRYVQLEIDSQKAFEQTKELFLAGLIDANFIIENLLGESSEDYDMLTGQFLMDQKVSLNSAKALLLNVAIQNKQIDSFLDGTIGFLSEVDELVLFKVMANQKNTAFSHSLYQAFYKNQKQLPNLDANSSEDYLTFEKKNALLQRFEKRFLDPKVLFEVVKAIELDNLFVCERLFDQVVYIEKDKPNYAIQLLQDIQSRNFSIFFRLLDLKCSLGNISNLAKDHVTPYLIPILYKVCTQKEFEVLPNRQVEVFDALKELKETYPILTHLNIHSPEQITSRIIPQIFIHLFLYDFNGQVYEHNLARLENKIVALVEKTPLTNEDVTFLYLLKQEDIIREKFPDL